MLNPLGAPERPRVKQRVERARHAANPSLWRAPRTSSVNGGQEKSSPNTAPPTTKRFIDTRAKIRVTRFVSTQLEIAPGRRPTSPSPARVGVARAAH